jgi:hypothetical protein
MQIVTTVVLWASLDTLTALVSNLNDGMAKLYDEIEIFSLTDRSSWIDEDELEYDTDNGFW